MLLVNLSFWRIYTLIIVIVNAATHAISVPDNALDLILLLQTNPHEKMSS